MPAETNSDGNNGDNSNANSNYVTVIPVEYSRNHRPYSTQPPEYAPEHYSDYGRNESFSEDINHAQNVTMYNLVQRIPTSREGYATLNGAEWAPSSSDTAKDTSSEVLSDKQSTPGSNSSSTSNSCSSSSTSALPASSGTTSDASATVASLQMYAVVPTCIYLLSRVALYMDIEDTANATVADMCAAIINNEELALNKSLTEKVFTLWMRSPLLDLQLKPNNKPITIRKAWSSDQRILELLYEEAKYNILEGRYPCEPHHCITLGGIQARIELGSYNPQLHSTHFFREQQRKFLPAHVRKSSNWTWLPISSKNSAEVRLLEQFKRIPTSATNRKLIRKYLEFCWSLPFYGAAFFQGQVEQPVRGLTSLMTHQDIPVLVGINSQGVYVIDDIQCTLLLGLNYEELSWEYARPSREDNADCLPCLFLQFMVLENGARVSKVLQVFSRQAVMMDTLISGFIDQIKKKNASNSNDSDRPLYEASADGEAHLSLSVGGVSRRDILQMSLSNKLSKLTLCTFDDEGRCIGQMGSWSFSY